MSKAKAACRVLVVEDESLLAMTLEMTLVDQGYRVVGPFGRLEQALQAAQEETFECALLDVNLNGQDVFPVANVLVQRAIPFAFLTGYDRETLPARYGSVPVLCKPIPRAVLIRALAALEGVTAH
jgi:CheY-like chemotaxis protein